MISILAAQVGEKASCHNPSLRSGHCWLSQSRGAGSTHHAGADSFRRALELNPNHSWGRQRYAGYLSAVGRDTEAIQEMQHAQDLDPLSPSVHSSMGLTYYWARQYDQAIEQCNLLYRATQSIPSSTCSLLTARSVLSPRASFNPTGQSISLHPRPAARSSST